jgi:Bacterial regulatory proteins, luxR family
MRNLVIGVLCRAGRVNLAAALRRHARDPTPTPLPPSGSDSVVAPLARGLQTKQVARALGISVKTADRHVQNAYGKIGVSTRAAAALFAMEHGLATWGEVPIVSPPAASSVLTQAPGSEIRCSSGGGGNEDHAPCAEARTEPRRWHP